ncbi:DNA internalization-related competence protein ComEC/Rec2 [Paenibacillus sp. YYML68]|uniref:DNA internalization-related competence protein ComEC/Rec2 n=1 Tax=Paenibacillus sp. YYML68 TaxID=2909250 RepID=UPI0024927E75|nr:DNA internalization-related competence protein ComEC/Rec2 [Paenibacillus sp. YYML68]
MTERPVVTFALCWALGYVYALVYGVGSAGMYFLLGGTSAVALAYTLQAAWRRWASFLGIIAVAAGWFGMYDARNVTQLEASLYEERLVVVSGSIVTPVTVDGDRVSFQAVAQAVEPTEEGDAGGVGTAIHAKGQHLGEQGQGQGQVNGVGDLPTAAPAPPQHQTELAERLQVSIRLQHEEEQAQAREWRRGDRIELVGTLLRPSEARNFGAFDYRRYLYRQHVHWQLSVKGLAKVEVTPPHSEAWGFWRAARWNDAFRDSLGDMVDQLFPAEQGGFMKGMLIGLTDEIDPQQFDAFSKLGLTHIIAISGLNVAIFVGCIVWVLRRMGLSRETYLRVAFLLIPLYIAMTGAAPSIMRAGIMAMIALYAAYRNRLKDGMHLVLITGVLMLVWNPYYLVDVSFQLSFLVTMGIILLVSRVSKLLPIRSVKLREAVSITLVAQFVSFPMTVYYFNQFSLLSFVANLALVPVFSMIVMPIGTIAMLVGFGSISVGGGLAWIVARVNDILFAVVGWSSRLGEFQLIWPTPSPVWMLVYYALLVCVVQLHELQWKQKRISDEPPSPLLETLEELRRKELLHRWNGPLLLPAAWLLFVSLLWNGYSPPEASATQGTVQVLDVGQGDSILIRAYGGDDRTLLVDGGGTVSFRKPGEEWRARKDPYEVGRKVLVPLLKKRGVQRIDELILTHQDADHFGGLQAVLEEVPVTRLLFNGTLKPNADVEKLFRTALEKGTQLVAVQAGDRLKLGPELELHVLYPMPEGDREAVELVSDQNPISVVFLMDLAGTRWLFTGDMGVAQELELLNRWRSIGAGSSGGSGGGLLEQPIDVLKVAHHGSKSSTAEAWLEAWRPRQAVISAGANNVYGHPSPQVVERLVRRGMIVHRTDRQGEVQFEVRDGRIFSRHKLE